MTAETDHAERQLSRLLLTASSTMIGVCATLIGLVKIMETRTGPSNVDKYAACIMVVFVLATLLSYLSIRRHRSGRGGALLETAADALFLLGLLCLTGVGLLFGYEVI